MKRTELTLIGLVLVAAAVAVGVWLGGLTGSGDLSPVPQDVGPTVQAGPAAVVPAAAPGRLPAAPAPTAQANAVATTGPVDPATFFREKIQARLNALAEAYNAGDAAAAERALDDNHAVIRPDGRTLYRSDVLGQWAIEWTQFQNRSLVFEVEFVEVEGDSVKALWTVDLRAEFLGEDSQPHELEFNGTQLAMYRKDGEKLSLQEPIRYTRAYQAIDGISVNPHQ